MDFVVKLKSRLNSLTAVLSQYCFEQINTVEFSEDTLHQHTVQHFMLNLDVWANTTIQCNSVYQYVENKFYLFFCLYIRYKQNILYIRIFYMQLIRAACRIAKRHEGKGGKTQTRTMTKFKIKDMKTRTWNRTKNRPYILKMFYSFVLSLLTIRLTKSDSKGFQSGF